MSFTSNYLELRKKRKQEEEGKGSNSFSDNYLQKRAERLAEEDDIAPVRASGYSAEDIYRSMGSTYKKKEDDEDDFWHDLASKMPNSIAAQKRKKSETSGTYFQKGALEDGFSAKNVAKAMLSTGRDLMTDIYAGMSGIVENTIDVGADIVGSVGGAFGAKDFRDDMDEFAKKDIINEQKVGEVLSDINGGFFSKVSQKIITGDTETEGASFLGEKTDALAQSGGQLVGTMLLQGVGVPWYVTTGVTSFGGEYEHALQEGATHGEANLSAAITAGAEMLTEKLFGGSGLGEKGLIDLDGLTKGISNKLVKRLLDFGLDMTAEGSEEVVSQFASNLGSALYREENLKDILFSEEAIDGYLDSFIGGFALGGVMNVGKVANSAKTGRDYRTGLTANEQAVFDKVFENEIAEREQDGKKLTSREKSEIYDDIMERLEKGGISTDDIESVLGGESYNAYKESVDAENALKDEQKALQDELKTLQDEYNGINKKQWRDMTGEEMDRRDEIKNRLPEIQAKLDEIQAKLDDPNTIAQRNVLKAQLSKDVYDMVKKNDRLRESYFEQVRSKQKFQADLSKYEGRARDVIKKVMDSKLADNTNQTHDFWDWVAKMAVDLDTDITLASNEQIIEMVKAEHEARGKVFDESKFAGQTIDGFASKSGIAINAASKRALNFVVGHEITHKFEKSKRYDRLQKLVLEYGKDEYESRFNERAGQYKNKFAADEKFKSQVDQEVTGDLIGDYVFNDKNFIVHLTKDRNVFQWVWDEIKYMAKIATAGSEQAKQLERVKREFERIYRENVKGKDTDGVRYNLSDAKIPTRDELNKKDPVKVIDISTPQTSGTFAERRRQILNNVSEVIAKPYLNNDTGAMIFLTEKSYKHAFNNLGEIQLNAAEHLPELIENAILTHAEDPTHGSEYANGVYTFFAAAKADGIRPVKLKVKEYTYSGQDLPKNIKAYFDSMPEGYAASYDTVVLEVEEIEKSPSGSAKDMNQNDSFLSPDELSTIKVADLLELVKGDSEKYIPKYSISDSDGKELSQWQQEFFKDSKMRDDDGNLKVMYHGSQDAGFHVFDASMSDDDTSFFFVDRNDVAATYSGTTETYEAKSFKTVEDANSFFAEIGKPEYEVVEKDGKYTLLDDGDEVATSDDLSEIYDEFRDWEGVGYGDANYKVYLNLTNPLVVDAEGRNWDRVGKEFSQSLYDVYKSFTEDEKAALKDLAEWEDFGVFKDELAESVRGKSRGSNDEYHNALASAYLKSGFDVNALFDLATADFTEEVMRETALDYLNTRDYAQRAKEQGYDGVIFKNIVDIGGYGNGKEGASTVAIAFDSNQIKSTANANPTADPDIRYSLSESNEQTKESIKVMDGGSVAKYSLSTWTPETQTKVRSNLIKAGYDVDRVDKWIKDTNGVASVIAADKDRLDFVAADNQTMLKNNQEYVKTLDASTLCAKRLVYQGTFDAIQHRLPNTMLSSDDLIDLLNMMKEHGVQTPCGVCYVESRRRHLGKFAQEWLNGYDGEYKPNLDEVTTSDGLEALRKSHPDTYEDFITAMKKKGSANPKVVQLRTEYRNEIMSLTPAQIRKIESIGGLRVQSFSDFETPHLLDMMQAVMDMSAKGLSSQAYTKVPNFAWVFGDTGIKINLSLIAEGDGFDSNGNLAFSSVEGMDINDALKLRNAYSENVGTIIVGANDKHILACMADDRIDFIIPFHRSGWGQKELDMMGMSSYTDYTYGQNEHDLKTGKGVANLYPPDYWDYTLSGKENAERYLNLCAKTGREPKFSQFLVNNGDGSYSLQPDGSTDGYWKTLIDFKMYDNEGNGAAQQKVQPNFNMEEAYRVLAEYEGGANKLPVAKDVVEEFVAKYGENIAPALSLSDNGQQYRDTGGYKYYSNHDFLNNDIAPVAETPSASVSEMESVAPVVVSEKETTTEAPVYQDEPIPERVTDLFPDGLAPTDSPVEVAPVAEQYEAIRPKREPQPRMVRADKAESKPRDKQRKWVGTSTESEVVDRQVLPEDLDQELIHYQPIPNRKTLGNANAKLNSLGYEKSVSYLEAKFADNKVTLDDIALGERLIQEAIKKGDTKTAGDLIMDISILGTELGQKVQALSIIKRLTPEGQLRMLQRTVERGKTKGDKAYEGVEVTQEMKDKILSAYNKDGSYDQAHLNEVVEDVKQEIADQMKVTAMDKVNAWRYLSMLGNPKTHIRNLVSNVAMRGTVAVKNAVARTIESVAPIENRTKTWRAASKDVKKFAQQTTMEMKDIISGDSKYSEDASIKEKRATFKNKILNGLYEFNSDMLSKEDWWFSKPAFVNSLSEYLTANGIRTEQDINKNPEITAKAIQYATEQSQIATFRQYSWLANEINRIERKNTATNVVVGSILPFKKTPVNIAKTGLSYSPLGFAKTLTYDIHQVKNGKMEASELVDHLAQNMTGTALTLVGYMLASSGFLNGAGDDDKEGKYDYQLGKQAYSVNIGGATFSLSWLSPVAMPLFVGANAYEQLVEGKEWNGDVVVETLAQTLDPLSEMSFISSLDSVLSSYDSGIQKFAGIGETMVQNYVTQFVPTLSSQIATVLDDTKRTTKVAGNSKFKFFDETINNLKYKIPFLRETLEPSTDIWGNEVKQTENVLTRAFETFLAPYAKRDDIASAVDEEIKDLYSQTGDGGVIPSVPYNYVNYDGTKYEMSAKEFTRYKETYGQKAYDLLEELFDTDMYQNADSETRADLVNDVYDYAREEAKRFFFERRGIAYTNATEEGEEYYKTNPIKGAIDNNMTPDEYSFSTKYPEKYEFFKANGISYDSYAAADEDGKRAYSWAYENPGKYTMSKAISDDYMTYYGYKQEIADIKENHVGKGEKDVVTDHIFNNMDLDYGQKVILYRSMYDSKADIATYNGDILDYLNSREDISYEDTVTILRELGFEVDSEGNVRW